MAPNANDARPSRSEPKAEEVAIRRNESRGKFTIDSRHWLSTPIVLAVLTVMGGVGGKLFDSYSNNLLERHKFEYKLIEKALSAPSQKESADTLKFFSTAGLLTAFNEKNIVSASGTNGEKLPIFHGAAIRDHLITVQQAKAILSHLNFYRGLNDDVFDDVFDLGLSIAVMKFQSENNLEIDGLIGPKTVFFLLKACPGCAGLPKIDIPTSNHTQ